MTERQALKLRQDTQHNDIQNNDTQHKKLLYDTLHLVTVSINDIQRNNALLLCEVSLC